MKQNLIVTIIIIYIYLIIYWKFIKNKKVINISQGVMVILVIPALIMLLDIWNCFDILIPNVYSNLTEKYDMLAFLGTYLSTIISSILLILVTNKDRKENTEIIQNSQRPYLDVRFSCIKTECLEKLQAENSVSIFYHGFNIENCEKKYEDLICLEIQNKGQTVAILDVNSIKVKINYYKTEKDYNGNTINILKEEEKELNSIITRMAIGKDEKVYIAFTYDYLYDKGKIKEGSIIKKCYIKYNDLFNKNYIDESIIDGSGNQYAIIDNEKNE